MTFLLSAWGDDGRHRPVDVIVVGRESAEEIA